MYLYFVICFVAVFLGGVVTETFIRREDISCVNKALSDFNAQGLTRGGLFYCQIAKDGIDRVRSDLEECKSNEIIFTKLKSLYEEFCNPVSDFASEFQRHHYCVTTGSHTKPCDLTFTYQTDMPLRDCKRVIAGFLDCLSEMALKNCGQSSLKVAKRINEVHEIQETITCLKVSSADGRSLFTWLILVVTIIALNWYHC